MLCPHQVRLRFDSISPALLLQISGSAFSCNFSSLLFPSLPSLLISFFLSPICRAASLIPPVVAFRLPHSPGSSVPDLICHGKITAADTSRSHSFHKNILPAFTALESHPVLTTAEEHYWINSWFYNRLDLTHISHVAGSGIDEGRGGPADVHTRIVDLHLTFVDRIYDHFVASEASWARLVTPCCVPKESAGIEETNRSWSTRTIVEDQSSLVN